jgi:subtilase family serine protease
MSSHPFRSTRSAFVAAFELLALLACVAFPADASRANPPFVSPVVAADVPHAAYRDMGVAPANTPVAIALILNYRHAAQLDQLIALQSDASSPYYRHWLTAQQFDASFAPTTVDYARAIASLRRAGFRIAQTYANRTVIDAVGTAAAADGYLRTRIDRVEQPGYGKRYANVTPAYVPSDISDLVFAVSGLQNLSLARTHYRKVERGAPSRLHRNTASAPNLFGPTSSGTGLFGYSPLAFAIGYDAPVTHDSQDNGKGRTAGIVIDADYSDTDLGAFLSYFGITRTGPPTVRVSVDGGPDKHYVNTDSLEATLDAESLVGVSPGVALRVYEIPEFAVAESPEKNISDAYDRVVSDNAVDTVNSSFGLCETADPSDTAAWDHIATQGVALGITFHASSGDLGSYACGNGGGVNAPASGPHFVAVGGTTLLLNPTGTYGGEEGWDGSGGGFSVRFALPSFQADVKNVNRLGRNLPDVSFDADPNTGIALYYGGSWNSIYDPLGGTSLASPLFGALLDQIEQLTGGRLGMVTAKLYADASAGYTRANQIEFHDVLMGSNGLYAAGIGYDDVTGLGSFDAWNLAHLLEKP